MMIFKLKMKFCIAIHSIMEDIVLRKLLIIKKGLDEKTSRCARGSIKCNREIVYREISPGLNENRGHRSDPRAQALSDQTPGSSSQCDARSRHEPRGICHS
jgi:hypothetical protein